LPLSNLNEANDDMNLVTSSDEDDSLSTEVNQKITPIYLHNIIDFDNFHNSLTTTTSDDFAITQTKNALKLNLSSIDDYRTITKKFDQSEIIYHTYQLPLDKKLSLIVRNLPVSISEETILMNWI
jgi:hypothetical protein